MPADLTTPADSDVLDEARFDIPPEECDLVMKGGVTSGIVYPQAVLALATKYRFRSVGGTSAGAIAAAMTAAAEYGRGARGFQKLKEITEKLGEQNGLLKLFQPDSPTRPLFNVLVGFLKLPEEGSVSRAAFARGTWSSLAAFGRLASQCSVPRLRQGRIRGVLLGIALGIVGAATSAAIYWTAGLSVPYAVLWKSVVAFGVPLAVVGYWVGGRVGSAYSLLDIATRAVPRNSYGLCSGMAADHGTEALTPWLHKTINGLAGLGEDDAPLTFAQLETRPTGPAITLRMITSNLSHGRPYELPFRERTWIAKAEDFDRLFPPPVMQYLTNYVYEGKRHTLPDGYFYLPEGNTLPVVVAARMSLSFPILFSAVPLYTIKYRADLASRRGDDNAITVKPEELQQNWFSDGGICSNFPIHFFDSWFPQRPAFGIKLTAFPSGAFTGAGKLKTDYLSQAQQPAEARGSESGTSEDDASQNTAAKPSPQPDEPIYLSAADRLSSPEWTPIDDPQPNLGRFLWKIFETAQNPRDNMLSDLPSYRERIVQIRLKEGEGGLNLTMDKETVASIMNKGTLAGERLLRQFSFQEHQWMRFLTVAARVEDAASEIQQSLDGGAFDPARLLSVQQTAATFPCQRTRPSWVHRSVERLGSATAFLTDWSSCRHFRNRPPEPEPTLQVTPRL